MMTSYNAGYIQDVITEQQLNLEEEGEEEESRIEWEPPQLTATVQLRSMKEERKLARLISSTTEKCIFAVHFFYL